MASIVHCRQTLGAIADQPLGAIVKQTRWCMADQALYTSHIPMMGYHKSCATSHKGEADLTDPQQAASVACAQDGDGMSTSSRKPQRGGHWTERVMAPFRFGFKELAPTLAKLGSAITITAVGKGAAQQLAAQLVSSHLKYQAALRASTAVASRR
ncbi:hypothetical protein DUNSADRAFT_9803 [Dunaliella salina]|uniref:Encoded protein n=1 Tax=Dunaliella salina TaxID=3046 RepID=A0ABQ7GGQ1_DUNSA|nr:hypothetical protein DUNSADRAFT_9803 [Dunaliella salina]|eukprot:KAF5833779.1 hypothetical protein DUNSADRAFT_9803 [Dunaliella salina]